MRSWTRALTVVAGITITLTQTGLSAQDTTPESRAVAFLEQEVPQWRREHPCYSCHNNGDAARALIAAGRLGYSNEETIRDTLDWLQAPGQWEHNASGGGVDDKVLARIQFAGALTSAVEAGLVPESALGEAATMVAGDQQDDGAWHLDASDSVGSPATYGSVLATWSAHRTLEAARDSSLSSAIERADRWLRHRETQNVLDSAAIALALANADDAAGRERRNRAVDFIVGGQAPDGGWGLYLTSPTEPFDTAVVLLALDAVMESDDPDALTGGDLGDSLARGRAFLIERQLADGSWPETTRPPGQESYAQRISTAGWATLALLATRD